MAGDIKRQRKSWTLLDRSKVSISILRANLAEEGDEDAQLDVAKRLLEESAGPEVPESTKNENARLALYWLIKSSEQGNDEATHLLQECLQSGRGLTAQNVLDIRTCVTTPKYEKLTFKAARLLHRKLSNGEEFITTTQLLARVHMNRKNVTFEEHSNGEVSHEQIHPTNEDHNPRDEHQNQNPNLQEEARVMEEADENSTDSGTSGSTPETNEPPPVPTYPHPLLKDIGLNETFVIPSSSSPSNIPRSTIRPRVMSNSSVNSGSFQPKISSSPKNPSTSRMSSPSYSPQSFERNSFINQTISPQNQALKLAMLQSGKKLTLHDLLNIAKDFNSGLAPKVSVDERNKILRRHKWELNSFLNTFIFQLLILSVVGKILSFGDALVYMILLGVSWASYNLFLWNRRHENFKDWKLAFESVLKEELWETDKFTEKFSQRYMTPFIVILFVGLGFLSCLNSSLEHFMVLSVASGVVAMISIQFGSLRRILPTWQQILILSASLIYYRSSIVIRLLGDSITEQTRFLHEPLISVGDSVNNLSLSISLFPVLICTCLATTVKLSFGEFLSKTIPEILLTLWLVKFVRESEECELTEFYVGVGVGLMVCLGMVCLSSKLELWKVFTGIMVIMILGSGLILSVLLKKGLLLSQRDVKFLEWEDYDTTCHRKAWYAQSPAATQIKCSALYDERVNPRMVKWKGRVSIVKIENLSRSFTTSSLEDVVFDISVGIFTDGNNEDGGGGSNWQNFNFLSGKTDGAELVAPASLLLRTDGIVGDRKRKKNLIDHILNLRSGDKIEFVGRLKGSTAGSVKPQIVDIIKIQCLTCAKADYGEVLIGESRAFDFAWMTKALNFNEKEIYGRVYQSTNVLNDYQNIFLSFIKKIQKVLTSYRTSM